MDASKDPVILDMDRLLSDGVEAQEALSGIRKSPDVTDLTGDDNLSQCTLCSRCASFRIADMFKYVANEARFNHCEVSQLGLLPDTLVDSLCALCRLFWVTKAKYAGNVSCSGYVLLSGKLYSSDRTSCVFYITVFPKRSDGLQWDGTDFFHIQEGAKIGIVANKDAERTQSDYFMIAEVPDIIRDYSFLQKWVENCESDHGEACSIPQEASTWPKRLALIHCNSLRIELLESRVRYAALSYVWGRNTTSDWTFAIGKRLPSDIPQLITDAISVTKECGIGYLWVDRYCIDQSDAMKHEQINQMDLIYKNALFTIIDAASSDPGAGLKGVSSNGRKAQPQARVGKYLLASTMADPRPAVMDSPWHSRGWTYQESFFSRLRIYFTEEQVYVECNAFESRESQPLVNARDFPKLPPVNMIPEKVFEHLYNFSKRRLSFDSDAIRAFAGLLNHFKSIEYPVHSLWGVPIMPDIAHLRIARFRPNERSQSSRFGAGLTWTNTVNSSRRKSFPSWSWAGWNGPTIYSDHSAILDAEMGDFIHIRLEDGQGGLIDLDYCDLNELADAHILHSHYFIHIYALFMCVDIKALPLSSMQTIESARNSRQWVGEADDGLFIVLQDDELKMEIPVYLFSSAVFDNCKAMNPELREPLQDILGLVLGRLEGCNKDGNPGIFVLLVRDQGTYFERVGHMYLGDTDTRVTPQPVVTVEASKLQPYDVLKLAWRLAIASGSWRSVKLG